MARQSFIIGRAGEIKLYDDTVSRRHACLEIDDDGSLNLRDLESRNGTYLIVDKKLTPFAGGLIKVDQVFAFGECVRSVVQLLEMIGKSPDEFVDLGATGDCAVDPFDVTVIGNNLPALPRLSHEDIVALLDRVDDDVVADVALSEACRRVGITEQRYERWRREHGATRAARSNDKDALQQENERLRQLVADLSLEREALREALSKYQQDQDQAALRANIALISDRKS